MKPMRPLHRMATLLLLTVIAAPASGQSQRDAAPAGQSSREATDKPSPAPIPVQIEVVLARYQAEKRISSLPYLVSVNANSLPATVRMGAEVPVPTMVSGSVGNQPDPIVPGGPVQYKAIGTMITCQSASIDGVNFDVTVHINDTSVYDDSQLTPGLSRAGAPPVFRSFQASNTMTLRDGQSAQFMAASDRITGETIRVEVKLTVVKR